MLELFWSVFSRVRTEYGKIQTRIPPNTDTFYAVHGKCEYSKYVLRFREYHLVSNLVWIKLSFAGRITFPLIKEK